MYQRVMVIDDSVLERFLAETVVKSSGFAKEVISFNNAPDALVYLEREENLPDVILLDIQMPVMTGFEFLDKYVQLPDAIQQHCKIIMFSSSLADEDMARVKKYPAVRKYLAKPLSEELFRGLEL
jgi:CheY-like chemotaxis protein